jgi:diguanylate cyclase (GGDEF)-like protein
VLLYPSGARNGDRQLEVTSRSQLIDQRQIHCLCLREHAPIQGDNALYDGLTGLAGAQLLREQVTRASKAAARKPSLHALLVIEIEQLAALKQRYGRQRTDRLMQALATRLTKSTRSENILSRIEQAQFALFVEDIANPSVAATVARQLLETIRRPVHIDEREMHCGGSIGIVLCPLDADNLPRLLLLGEQAIATARGHGANQFAFYNGEIHAAASREYAAQIDSLRASDELAASFVDAREQDLVRLVLQPVASLSPLERAGARAMPQWPGAAQDADIEQLYAMAEAAGGADALSEYLLQAVCTYCRHNRDDTQLIRVKIAASHFWRPHFVDEVAKALKTSGAYPQRIMLTFEEAMLSAEVKASAIKLHQLERLGCKLGLDQFANSNTSLLLLPNCAFAEVAISTAWIKSIGTSRQDLKTLRGMVTFCHQLALQVRVDGVSTDNHLKVADAIGGNFASGSLIQRRLNSSPPDTQ